MDFIEGDLADRGLIENIFKAAKSEGRPFENVLHFAALIEAGESMVRPETFFRNNTASTLALLEAVIAEGPRRIVFSSTAAVYGEPESVPIKEDARLKPTNVYGESKLMVETMLNWFHAIHGLRSVSLRYFNVAGAPEGPEGITRGENHEPESHLIPLILDVALGRRQSIRIYGDDYPTPDGTCIRDYIHVSDLADAHVLAVEALETDAAAKSRLIFNLGNGQGFSVREVIESARRVTGHTIPAELHPRRAGRSRGAGGKLRKSDARARLETKVYAAGRYRSHGMDMAPEAVQRVGTSSGGSNGLAMFRKISLLQKE